MISPDKARQPYRMIDVLWWDLQMQYEITLSRKNYFLDINVMRLLNIETDGNIFGWHYHWNILPMHARWILTILRKCICCALCFFPVHECEIWKVKIDTFRCFCQYVRWSKSHFPIFLRQIVCFKVIIICYYHINLLYDAIPHGKVHGADMGPTWCRQDPGGPMLATWTLLSGVFI